MVWLAVSVVGLATLPFVGRRRSLEERYVEIAGETPARMLLLESRRTRAATLSLGVLCGSAVPVVLWLTEPSEERRIITIVLLIAEYAMLVTTLVMDEWYAARIDRLGRRK